MNEFHIVRLNREDLQKAIEAFDTNSEYVTLSIEIDTIEGDQVLWVDNGKWSDNREYIKINKPHKRSS